MAQELRHLISDAPRVMVVDGSKLVRKLIADVLQRELPGVKVIGCASIAEAREALAAGEVHLVTTALALPDGDGMEIARSVREAAGQAYVPVIVVSGDAQQHLEERRFTEFVTDYFDKALGHEALATIIRGYVQPEPVVGATILYIEDSRVVAETTKRMLERQALNVVHVMKAEDAFALLTAESLEMSYSLWSLIRGGRGPVQVTLVKPVIRLDAGAQSGWRVATWKSGASTGRPPRAIDFVVRLRDARVVAPRPYGGFEGLDLEMHGLPEESKGPRDNQHRIHR